MFETFVTLITTYALVSQWDRT